MKLIPLLLAVLLAVPGCAHAAPAPARAPAIFKVNFNVDVDDESADWMEGVFSMVEAVKPTAVLIRIDSHGGSVDSGFRIIKAIRASRAPVHCVVDGEADSMAFIILQACTTRGMTAESRLMAHQPYFHINSYLHYQDLITLLNDIMTTIEQVEILCATRMGMTLAAFREKTNGIDWWMSSIAARQYNAVDYVASTLDAVVQSLEKTGELPLQP